MKKEKTQKIFVYFTVFLTILTVIFFVVYFIYNSLKWAGYRNDENKIIFVERLVKAKEALKNKKSAENYLEIGNNYYNLEEYGLATKTFEKAIEIFQDAVIYNNLANVYKAQKKYKRAEETYLEIINFKPSEASTYLNLHSLYKTFWFGQRYSPVSILEKGLGEMGDNTNLLNTLAVFYRDTGEKEKAIKYFERSLEINSDNEVVKRELEDLKNQ